MRFRFSIVGLALLQSTTPFNASAQARPERFWVAGHYDDAQMIIYFDHVDLDPRTFDSVAEALPCPADRMCPSKLPASYVAEVEKQPDRERFAVGDRYDLLLDDGFTTEVTLTTLIGFRDLTNTGIVIGALASVGKEIQPHSGKDFYLVRRQRVLSGPRATTSRSARIALLPGPVQPGIQAGIGEVLTRRLRAEAGNSLPDAPTDIEVCQFRLADGTLRYFVKAHWSNEVSQAALAAWISPQPTLHILAVIPSPEPTGEYLPSLENVIDLGGGRAAVILNYPSEDGTTLDIRLYRDGNQMQALQTIIL